MSKSSNKKAHGANKDYKLIHQIVCITSIDFDRKALFGFVELHILPQVPVLSRIKVNCKQCSVYRVCVKGHGLDSWLEAAFLNDDPLKNLCPDSKKRNLDYLFSNIQKSVLQTEPINNGGEITIRLPSETMKLVEDKKILRVSIEFVLDNPSSGIHFVVPKGGGTTVERACHMFTTRWGNSTRLWFPCIDSANEICTWKIEVTVDNGMTVVSAGELIEKVYTPDEKRTTHHFILTVPTAATNIAIAVGPFDILPDPEMADVTYFVLPGLKELIKPTAYFLSELFEFFEESLGTSYPFPCFKLVFVSEALEDQQSFASMGILNTKYLHHAGIIDQPFETRPLLVQCLAEQFFGMFVAMNSWADSWLLQGISRYLSGTFRRKTFGNNDYRDWLRKELECICDFDLSGSGLPPLYPLPLVAGDQQKDSKSDHKNTTSKIYLHPHLTPYKQLMMMRKKSHLILRMIEQRIGQDLLLQTFNKVLSLASSASSKRSEYSNWSNMLLSTTGFLRTISTVSGKDVNLFLDKWICNSGVAKFTISFSFNRKRNIVEMEITQNTGKGCQKYVGPLGVCIQELDGSFSHTVQVEDTVSNHELPCHSKSRRNKKKKIPLVTGEEVDMDLNATFDSDSPVLWIRIDPDMTVPRKVILQQPDYMWQYQLRYERDIISQIEAVNALGKFPSQASRNALIDTINHTEPYYKVRLEACTSLAKVCSSAVEAGDGHNVMFEIFEKLFGSNSCPSIPKFSDFSNFVNYFLQKHLPNAISLTRDSNGQCSSSVINFILGLLKHHDNRNNQFCDGYYVSALIDALQKTISPASENLSKVIDKSSLPIDENIKKMLKTVNRHINMELIIPSFRYAVTCSCLKLIRTLQVEGHIPAESAFFWQFSRYGLFEDVRLTAFDLLVDFIQVQRSEADFNKLLEVIKSDPMPSIRHHIIQGLISKPPFGFKDNYSSMNKQTLVDTLWKMIVDDTSLDYLIRCDLMEFYETLWGRGTPNCSSAHGVYVESRKSILSPRHHFSPDRMHVEEEPTSKRVKQESHESDIYDSRPGTPMSFSSDVSFASKIKLKIKIGEDGNVDSGNETNMGAPSAIQGASGVDIIDGESKKNRKKKKKKHKHKEKRNKPDHIDVAAIPGVNAYSLDERLGVHSPPHTSEFTNIQDSIPEETKENVVSKWIPAGNSDDYCLDEDFTETAVKYEISDVEMSPIRSSLQEDLPGGTNVFTEHESDISI